jgi:hypothetical protein
MVRWHADDSAQVRVDRLDPIQVRLDELAAADLAAAGLRHPEGGDQASSARRARTARA